MGQLKLPFDSDLAGRVGFLYGQEIGSDVVFTLKDETAFPAHSVILAISSPVFHAMFFGSMPETKGAPIAVPDVEPAAFRQLLRYIYTDILTPDINSALSLLYAGRKYQVPGVEKACTTFLDSNVDGDNAIALLTHTTIFDAYDLQEKCFEVIDKRASVALACKELEALPLETLCLVLQRDGLQVKEHAVYAAVCRWAKAQCKRQPGGIYGNGGPGRPGGPGHHPQRLLPLWRPTSASSTAAAERECRIDAELWHYSLHPVPLQQVGGWRGGQDSQLACSLFLRCPMGDEYGFHKLAKLEDILDHKRGLIKNDSVILEARLENVS